jgi:hypothetical protein
MLSSNAGWARRIGGTGLTETTGTTLWDAADDDDDDDEESDPSSPSFDEAAGLDLTRGGEGLRFVAELDPSTASRCTDVRECCAAGRGEATERERSELPPFGEEVKVGMSPGILFEADEADEEEEELEDELESSSSESDDREMSCSALYRTTSSDSFFQSERSSMMVVTKPDSMYPMTTAAVCPWRLIRYTIVMTADMGRTTSQLPATPINVASRYRFCAPTKVQAMVPTVNVMLPKPKSGIRSAMRFCRRGSVVSHTGSDSPAMKMIDVVKSANTRPTQIDLYADFLARPGCPEPRRIATRTSPASAMASVTFSTVPHRVPRILQAETSAGPSALCNKTTMRKEVKCKRLIA